MTGSTGEPVGVDHDSRAHRDSGVEPVLGVAEPALEATADGSGAGAHAPGLRPLGARGGERSRAELGGRPVAEVTAPAQVEDHRRGHDRHHLAGLRADREPDAGASRAAITPSAAASPYALPPVSTTACTRSITARGSSRSVSRVPGPPPRTSTPPTAPARGKHHRRAGQPAVSVGGVVPDREAVDHPLILTDTARRRGWSSLRSRWSSQGESGTGEGAGQRGGAGQRVLAVAGVDDELAVGGPGHARQPSCRR